MSNFKFIIFLIAIFAMQSNLFASSVSTNKQVIDSIFNSFYSSVALKLTEKNIDEIKIIDNPNFNYFINKLINELSYKNINVNNYSSVSLKLDISEFEILYTESGNDFNRIININAKVFLIDKNGELNSIANLAASYKDAVKSDAIKFIENDFFPFTKGKAPETKRSFFDEVIEPVIFVGAAVLTVVLFFSVRTK